MKIVHQPHLKVLCITLLAVGILFFGQAAVLAEDNTATAPPSAATAPTATTTTPSTATTSPTTDPVSVTQGPVGCGIELTTGSNCSVNGQMGEEKILGIIKQIINVASLLVGAICVLMIIFGGFRYMISGGDSGGVTTAKNTILYAVVGLVVVLLSQALVRFVFTRTTAA